MNIGEHDDSTFAHQGYQIFRGLYSENEIRCLTQHIDYVYRIWMSENEPDLLNYGLVNMHSLTHPRYFTASNQKRIDFFQAIFSANMVNRISAVFDAPLYFHNTQLFFNPASGKKLPYWHRDIQYNPYSEEQQQVMLAEMTSLHVRIPLVPESGIELMPGSHKRWDHDNERRVRLELDGHKNSENLPNAHLIHLEPGDVLLFSANMLHRGNYALNPQRKALDLCVGTVHAASLAHLNADILLSETDTHQVINNAWLTYARQLLRERESS